LDRNRLVAELCKALVVIEAPAGSGSLITAKAAMELGKPVFVVPGPVNQDTFKGSHAMIRNGATLVDDPTQVLEAIGIDMKTVTRSNSLVGDELAVFELLAGLAMSPEMISHESGLSTSEVLSALTMLEIEGLAVRNHEGYSRKP